ncbi:MAG: YmdB family metallophosphoesterase [Verrucomicrobia bacterium]|nr:MAG: YmdB family metallophosphoesterase [Verrucomicrobiota bacterium]
MRVMFLGDVVGRPGREYLRVRAGALRAELDLDFLVVNAENAAAGAGITGAIARQLLDAGIDAITLGDHVWDQRGFESEIVDLQQVCRPANLPEGCPGRRWVCVERDGVKLAVFTMLGRQFLPPRASCPFRGSDALLEEIRAVDNPTLAVAEIHAEATSEKIAFGRYLDGRVAAVVGTHTHVPTADACILPAGTGYVTDLGMCGPYDSVLGRDVDAGIRRFLDGMPRRFGVASDDVRLCGVVFDFDVRSGRTIRFQPFREDAPVAPAGASDGAERASGVDTAGEAGNGAKP